LPKGVKMKKDDGRLYAHTTPTTTTITGATGAVGYSGMNSTTSASGSGYTITYPSSTFLPNIHNWAIGFDRQWNLLENFHTSVATSNYPPYNIVQNDENEYLIEMAVAGFSKKDIEVIQQEQSLTIKGTKASSKDTTYVHKGIGARDFKQEFALAEYVDVDSADITDGILTITLRRELPEEKKPRTIKVN